MVALDPARETSTVNLSISMHCCAEMGFHESFLKEKNGVITKDEKKTECYFFWKKKKVLQSTLVGRSI